MTFSHLNQRLHVLLALNQKLQWFMSTCQKCKFCQTESSQHFAKKNPPKYAYWRKIAFFKLEAPRLLQAIFDFLDFKYKAPREMDPKSHRTTPKTTFWGTLHNFGPQGLCLV